MQDPEIMIGFDGGIADDDVSVVVMRRGVDGRWQVDSTEGPGAGELARMADVALAALELPDIPQQFRRPVDWPAQIAEWFAEFAGPVELTDWQRDLLARQYEQYAAAAGSGRVAPICL